MAVTYQQLLHDVALRMNALVGAQFSPLATTYNTATLTAANFKSADWPFNSFRDAIMMAEQEIASAVAHTPGCPAKSALDAATATFASGTLLSGVDASGFDAVIGPWGNVRDSSDNISCVEMPLDLIRRINQDAWRIHKLYYYRIEGSRIYHTRPLILMDVSVYNRTDQAAAFDAGTSMLLPDNYEGVVVARAVSIMAKDHSYMDQARFYREYSDQALANILSGKFISGANAMPPEVAAV